MPKFNWSFVVLGVTEAPSAEALEKTIKNQISISANVSPSVHKIVVTSAPESGLVTPPEISVQREY